MSTQDARARERLEEHLARILAASRAFTGRARSQAGVILRDLIDPRGESVLSLVDGERSAGAAALALPIDLITFETWLLGQLGDRDELDLDVGAHRETWFGLGAWIGETLRDRHGGQWLLMGEEPASWRIGMAKIFLEIAPHAFAEKLLRSGEGLGRRLVAEIERIRLAHDQAKAAEGGKLKDRFGPQHYVRAHTVPTAQWLAVDLTALTKAWSERPAAELAARFAEAGKKLPPQNAPALAKVSEALAKLEGERPAGEQVQDRGLFEAVAQVLALRRATAPVAADVLEKVFLPALHIGLPDRFPPLGADDISSLRRGTDLFAVYVDVVPYARPAEEGGFLGTFSPGEMRTVYSDRKDLELGRGDWVAIDPSRLRPVLERFDPKRMLACFDRFVEHVARQDGVPRLSETGRGLAEAAAMALADLRACVGAVGIGGALVFRLMPPPA